MVPENNTSVSSRVISAFFDTAGAAKTAVDDLVNAGIPRQAITQRDGQTAGEDVTTTAEAREHKGFWESLKDLFLPDEDAHTYAEGLQRGGTLITARVDEANYGRVLDILDRDGAVDMDARSNEWRQTGWSGSSISAGTDAEIPGGLAADTSSELSAVNVGRRDTTADRPRVRSYSFGEHASGFTPTGFDPLSITEHMEVISADGQTIGTVDHLDGPNRIKLAKNTSPDGQHHYVPFAWINHVDQHVHLNRTLADIKADPSTQH